MADLVRVLDATLSWLTAIVWVGFLACSLAAILVFIFGDRS